MDSSKGKSKQEISKCGKAYLFSYNLILFVVFLAVNVISVINSVSNTGDKDTIQWLATVVRLVTYAQLMEAIHPMLGLVPGGAFMPFTQVTGRMIVNLFISDPEICTATGPFVLYLFVVWSAIEIFRYSLYALKVLNIDIYAITWCRYTLFIPLYPMGGFCEAQVILTTVKIYEKTGTYSVGLPNPANMSFHLPSMLRFYTFFILGPAIYSLMRYMSAQRRKALQLGSKSCKDHST